ncbi:MULTISPECIES: hypothetical protein [unclassified Streptomyces]|uniref:hypothetical protein n=1 Tax=unclassified Streptomyces TaxID=2593676 RepID=UPI003D74FD1E
MSGRRRGPVRARGRGLVPGTVVALVAGSALLGLPAGEAVARPPQPDAPDVAVVTRGDTGRTTTLRSGEPDFTRLWQLLQPTYTGTTPVSRAWDEGRYPAVRATVVWGLTGVGGWPRTSRPPGGDVALERQDQVFLAEDGTPWVRSDPAPEVADDDIRWHRASRAAFDRLERSGLLGAERARPTAQTGSGRTGALRWAVPGLAVGVLLGAAGTALIRRAALLRDSGPPHGEPRQELIDL